MIRIILEVDQNDRGNLQVSICGTDGIGYRIAGPKYDGTGQTLLRHEITPRDVDEIRFFLRQVRKNPRRRER